MALFHIMQYIDFYSHNTIQELSEVWKHMEQVDWLNKETGDNERDSVWNYSDIIFLQQEHTS